MDLCDDESCLERNFHSIQQSQSVVGVCCDSLELAFIKLPFQFVQLFGDQ